MLHKNNLKRSRGTVVVEVSIMNLEELMFTWKGRHLVLALFASILLTEQISLSDCLSWDNGQYVYCNCLLTRLRRNKFWN